MTKPIMPNIKIIQHINIMWHLIQH